MTDILSIEIAKMQKDAEMHLPSSGQIRRRTITKDSAGTSIEAWTNLGSTVACRIGLLNRGRASEQVFAERLGSSVGYTITFPVDTDITDADQVVVDARTFEVVGVPVVTWEITRRVICKEVK